MKFRVWDKLNKSFYLHDKGYQGHYVIGLDGSFCNLQNGAGGDECVVQSSTGLKDTNGVELYEGDVISCERWYFDKEGDIKSIGYVEKDGSPQKWIGHIWYANPCPYIAEWAVSFNHLYSECSSTFKELQNVSIIGNIYENPTLISDAHCN